MFFQHTIRRKTSCTGIGLHTGSQINLEILPAPADSGISFVRTDIGRHADLQARIEHVGDTTLATTLRVGVNGSSASISTVEHLLAAFAGTGIDNATVLVDGPEIPSMDGSSGPFVDLLENAGTEPQRHLRKFLAIKKEVKVQQGDKSARLTPGAGLSIRCKLDFDHPLIPKTPFRFRFSEKAFQKSLAWARTFGFLKDVQQLRARGLAQGGSLSNAVVIDQYRVLNPEGLRYPDEFIRHKVLDAVGDLSLFGMRVLGKLELDRSGHALNTELVRQVLADPKAYEIVVPSEKDIKERPSASPVAKPAHISVSPS